jgi:hypothetical protein
VDIGRESGPLFSRSREVAEHRRAFGCRRIEDGDPLVRNDVPSDKARIAILHDLNERLPSDDRISRKGGRTNEDAILRKAGSQHLDIACVEGVTCIESDALAGALDQEDVKRCHQ